MSRSFYLVQRIKHAPWRAKAREENADLSPTARIMQANPFGYGKLGDYDLDYMGAAEFEWGANPEGFDRLREVGKKLVICEWEYRGHVFDFLYREKDGEPFEAWTDWAEGRFRDDYDGRVYDERPFYGKEPPYELQRRLDGEKPFSEDGWRTAAWWALGENVMWAFKEDGHLARMLESMRADKAVTLRG